jgi:hypothetical protein
MGDQLGVTREASHADNSLDAVVNRRQPPAARAAHAHTRGRDPILVHFRPRLEVVEQALFVSQHHAQA